MTNILIFESVEYSSVYACVYVTNTSLLNIPLCVRVY